ncbi:MAG: DsrE family protein [Candidatus Bathyarchaeota archaeon]|nr:DsrE family protein [Candidatus Bathyarchaeota archaeon]
MPEKSLLIIIRSPPHTTLDPYEGTRVAAGLIEHRLRMLYTGDGVYAATKNTDHTLTGQFLSDLPDLGVEFYADAEAMRARGLREADMLPMVKVADDAKMKELVAGAEASLSF